MHTNNSITFSENILYNDFLILHLFGYPQKLKRRGLSIGREQRYTWSCVHKFYRYSTT